MAIICLYLIFFLALLGGGFSCPEGFERHGNRCYKVMELSASWAEAKVYCSVIGGDLADIEDANENAIILGIISRLHGSTTSLRFWLDGSDMLAENEWWWMGQKGTSRLMSFTNWKPPQPDNINNNANCLEIEDGHFNDYDCDGHKSFLCESRVCCNVKGRSCVSSYQSTCQTLMNRHVNRCKNTRDSTKNGGVRQRRNCRLRR